MPSFLVFFLFVPTRIVYLIANKFIIISNSSSSNSMFIVYYVKLNKDGTEFRTNVGLVVSKRKRCYIYIVIAIKT